ncbi:MAG: hypothetical protein JWM19_3894 [Actinomycetia bacterium]|nr:hypothetical protein [Actinomycetes bacterium]
MNLHPVHDSLPGMDQWAAGATSTPPGTGLRPGSPTRSFSPQAAGTRLEPLARFAADREAIITALLGATDPGPITAIEPVLGNSRTQGRSVTRLSFADGRKLIYRPHSVTTHAWFGGVLDWVNLRIPHAGLRIAAVLPRPGYGWTEFITHQPPSDPVGMDQFHRRYGMLLAVLYALDALGIQSGRLLASGDCPVPVNVEAIFHPSLTTPDATADPAAAMLAVSVHRTGLLQAMGAPACRVVRQRPHDPAVPEMAVLAGFRLGYDAIAAHRDEFTRLACSAHDFDVRFRARLDRAISKIAGLSEVDRRDQEWIVSATLAALRLPSGHNAPVPPPPSLSTVAAEPARLLAVACGLADQIVSQGITGGSASCAGRVNWLSLQAERDGEWAVLPMGPDLGNGYLGVALYLAQLADLTGIERYAEVARQALDAMPAMFMALNDSRELLEEVGCGGYNGLSGIGYGLARMSSLLRDSQLREWAATAVGLASAAASPTSPPGWADGTAGCLAAVTAVWSEIGSREAARLARTAASRLAELVERTDGWCADAELTHGGLARGPAGIGLALARFAAATGEQPYLMAGRRAVRRAVSAAGSIPDPAHGWCQGTAGLLVARCLTDEASPAQLRAGLITLGQRPVLRDLSLCKGELGIAEALSVVSLTGRVRAPQQVLRRRAGLLLDALHRQSRYCGTPGGVSTPGLLNGLAGIGYGLLRLGFPERVPAVLAMEPTSAGRRDPQA